VPSEVDPLEQQTEAGPKIDPLGSLQLDVVLKLQELGNSVFLSLHLNKKGELRSVS
jgi:hypothetical protein